MSIENALASLPVKDLKAASAWYEELFGRPADSKPMPEVQEWKFPRGGWLQVYELAERAGTGSCTLAVDDLAGQITKLKVMGVDTAQQSSNPKLKVVMVTDPDGNHIAFAQALDGNLAH